MRKKCSCCQIEKEIREFYSRKGGLYAKHAECKKCLKEKNRNYRNENQDKIYVRDCIYRHRLKELYADSHENSRIRISERTIMGFERYAEKKMKLLAGSLLNYAVRIKLVEKPSKCSICKKEKEIQGHHPDYSKPLQVAWVCIECHARFHTR